MTKVLFVYATAADADSAASLGEAAVEARLAACANVLPAMKSIYRWRDAIERADEAVLILKTTEDRFDALKALLARLHPYEVPCIVALPVAAGDAPFLNWVHEETRGPSD